MTLIVPDNIDVHSLGLSGTAQLILNGLVLVFMAAGVVWQYFKGKPLPPTQEFPLVAVGGALADRSSMLKLSESIDNIVPLVDRIMLNSADYAHMERRMALVEDQANRNREAIDKLQDIDVQLARYDERLKNLERHRSP